MDANERKTSTQKINLDALLALRRRPDVRAYNAARAAELRRLCAENCARPPWEPEDAVAMIRPEDAEALDLPIYQE